VKNNRKNSLAKSLEENLSIINLKYDDNREMSDDDKRLLERKPKFVEVDYLNLLPNPPANNSSETKQELEQVRKRVERVEKSPELKNLVMAIDINPDVPFEKIAKKHGIKFPAREMDRIYYHIIEPIMWQLKWKYNRPRPYQLAKKLGMDFKHFESPRKTHYTPSYPSGHAMYGYLVALILSDMYPEHVKEWMEAAKVVGDARVNQGVHYPSDMKASAYITKLIWDDIKDKYENILT
tara:strand:- start:8 stop:718 length:711 start_codon:yes stop_codon:yes gene_type:complete